MLAHRRDDATVVAPAGACVGALAAPTPAAAEPVLRTAVVMLRPRRAGAVTLGFAGVPVPAVLPAGTSTVVVQTYGAIGPVTAPPGVCLLSSRSFIAAP